MELKFDKFPPQPTVNGLQQSQDVKQSFFKVMLKTREHICDAQITLRLNQRATKPSHFCARTRFVLGFPESAASGSEQRLADLPSDRCDSGHCLLKKTFTVG